MKILIFSRDPGGTNNVFPLIERMKSTNVNLLLYAKDGAIARFKNYGIDAEDLTDHIDNIEISSINSFLKIRKPDVIITGTSLGDMTERFIWKAAKSLNIKCLAILDQWMNYVRRFSDTDEFNNCVKGTEFKYMPDYICVMDEVAKKEMLEQGFDASLISVTGSPYFDYINEQYSILKVNYVSNRQHTIAFVSEPTSSDYNNAIDYWGFDEKKIFSELLGAIELDSACAKNCTILIKLHPREDSDYYQDFINNYKGSVNLELVPKEMSSLELIKSVDLICGMSSMLLIEAFMLSKSTLSIMLGLKRENPFVLDRIGLVRSITDKNLILRNVIEMLNKPFVDTKMTVVRDATNNIIKLVEGENECFGN